MLAKQEGLLLLGQAENGKELQELVCEKHPDIVITDIKMPVMGGIEATRLLLQKFPGLKIIALSMFDEENLIIDMLEAGAKGYLLKNADKKEILEAIDAVYGGQYLLLQAYFCPPCLDDRQEQIWPFKEKKGTVVLRPGKGNHLTYLQADDSPADRGQALPEQAHSGRIPD